MFVSGEETSCGLVKAAGAWALKESDAIGTFPEGTTTNLREVLRSGQ
jgi:hypothetical protein